MSKETKNYKINPPWSRIQTDGWDYGMEFHGIFLTPSGFVRVSSINRKRPITILNIAIERRKYRYRLEKYYSARYLVTLATRFAAAMSRKRQPNQ